VNNMKSRTIVKAELSLMGKVVAVDSNVEAAEITDYILNVVDEDHLLSGQQIISEHVNRYGENIVKYMVVNTVMDWVQITYVIEDEEYPVPENLDTYDGVFGYVYNVSDPELSELGYVFFGRKPNGTYKRIG